MVSFTGSTNVGRRIGEACGSLIKPCVLELGGKSAAIVLPDADVDAAIPVLVGASVGTNAGQSCVCMSRILVQREDARRARGQARRRRSPDSRSAIRWSRTP